MKHRGFRLVLVLAVVLCGRLALGQDSLGPQPKKALTPSDYKPRTLRQIAADEAIRDAHRPVGIEATAGRPLRAARAPSRARLRERDRPAERVLGAQRRLRETKLA